MTASDFWRGIAALMILLISWGYFTPWLFNSSWGVLNLIAYVLIFATPYLVYLALKPSLTKILNNFNSKGN